MGELALVRRLWMKLASIGAQANLEKQRLETKQRAARKAADRGEPIRPRWFNPVPGAVVGEQQAYVYTGGYWCALSTSIRPG